MSAFFNLVLYLPYDLVTNSSSLVFVESLKVRRLLKYSLYWKAFADYTNFTEY